MAPSSFACLLLPRGPSIIPRMSLIRIHLEDGRNITRPERTPVGSLATRSTGKSVLPPLAALINNSLSSLSYPLAINCRIRFVDMSDPHGWRVYRNSLCFLLAKAIHDLFPSAAFAVGHSFGTGLYCTFALEGSSGISRKQLRRIDQHMRTLVARNIPIERHKIAYAEAVRLFSRARQHDKLNLLKFRNPPHVVLHDCDGFSDLAHGPLAPSTGCLTRFQLVPYPPGFVLNLPEREKPRILPRFRDQPHLFNIFKEHKRWGNILGVNTVGRLNELAVNGEIEEFMKTAEALHEKKVAAIADAVSARKNRVRCILIAGPSSAGKTTFAKRLSVHLTVAGMKPVTLSTDDYFVPHDRTPRDADGRMDYEHIDAVDILLFNRQLNGLMKGRKVDVPRFDFERKRPVFGERSLQITDQHILIVEGIHGLNPRLTRNIAPSRKFRIYVSALTQLNLDANNRISTTDNRLMRRMIRDCRFRGHSPLATLRLWPLVRRGEKRWIFPFQGEADATFNSALDYELAVLKPLVEPLLMQIKPTDSEYSESRRLTEFLLNFVAVPDRLVPRTSILREYIGGSSFRY